MNKGEGVRLMTPLFRNDTRAAISPSKKTLEDNTEGKQYKVREGHDDLGIP